MALMLPKVRGVRREASTTGRLTTTYGTTLTAHATPHTEPTTKTQLIASTSFDSYWINVYIHDTGTSVTLTDSLVNIYVGACIVRATADPEPTRWISDRRSQAPTEHGHRVYGFPLRIPAGTTDLCNAPGAHHRGYGEGMGGAAGWGHDPALGRDRRGGDRCEHRSITRDGGDTG